MLPNTANIALLKEIHASCKEADKELRPLLDAFESRRLDLVAQIFDQYESQMPPSVLDHYKDALLRAANEREVKFIKGEVLAAALSIYKLVSSVLGDLPVEEKPTQPVPVPRRDGSFN